MRVPLAAQMGLSVTDTDKGTDLLKRMSRGLLALCLILVLTMMVFFAHITQKIVQLREQEENMLFYRDGFLRELSQRSDIDDRRASEIIAVILDADKKDLEEYRALTLLYTRLAVGTRRIALACFGLALFSLLAALAARRRERCRSRQSHPVSSEAEEA